jgi:transposase
MKQSGFLGIDVGKGYSDFLLLDSEKQILEEGFVLNDTKKGRQTLTRLIESWFADGLTQLYCGVESTVGYENNWYSHLCNLAGRYEIKVARLNPKAVKACGEAAMVRTQTDQVSAFTIASYMIGWPEKITYSPRTDYPEDPLWLEIRQQVRFLDMLIKQCVQLTNQLEKLLYQQLGELLIYCRNGIPEWLVRLLARYPSRKHLLRAGQAKVAAIKGLSQAKAGSLLGKIEEDQPTSSASICHTIQATSRQIVHLQTQIKNEKKFLSEQFGDHPDVKLLDSIKGVGVDSAVRMVVEIEDITRFDSASKLCAYFGVHPTWKQSGDGIWYQGMSKKGRSAMRATLFMCSLTAIRWNPSLRKLYHNFRAKGMNHYQAMGVVMHKLLRIVYGILKHKTPYDPAIDQKNRQQADKHRKQYKQRLAEKKQQRKNRRERFNTPDQPEQIEIAPMSRRAYKKKKQEASQSSDVEEHAGSPPAY